MGSRISFVLLFASVLALNGVLFIAPPAVGQSPAGALEANPQSVNWMYPFHVPGDTFQVSCDVVNVMGLFAFQAGFYFNQTYLECTSVVEGGFLSNSGTDFLQTNPGIINNTNGMVTPFGWSLTDSTKAKTGSGHLITATFRLRDVSPLYTGVFPGTPVNDMLLSVDPYSSTTTILVYEDGVTIISPPQDHVISGTFTLTIYHGPPQASFKISLPPPYCVNESLTFDASASNAGAPIVDYKWDFGDGNVTHTAVPAITHRYTTVAVYSVTLVLTDLNGGVSPTFIRSLTVLPAVSISPTYAMINPSDTLPFASTVFGGTPPYSYQWYLNGVQVPTATNSTWVFRPASEGMYNIYLNATDLNGFAAKSNVVRVDVIPPGAIGGVSTSVNIVRFFSSWLSITSTLIAAVILRGIIIKKKRRYAHRNVVKYKN
jgi:PKD repeat protein